MGTWTNPYIFKDEDIKGIKQLIFKKPSKRPIKDEKQGLPYKKPKVTIYGQQIKAEEAKKAVEQGELVRLGREYRCKSA